MRILALDVGSVRIGVAVSDEDAVIAQPLEFIDAAKGTPVPAIFALCRKYSVNTVIVGLPLSLNGGDKGVSSRRAKALGAALEKKHGLTVIFRDERFSTGEADRALLEGNVRRSKRKDVVDKVAAALILQGYLDGQKSSVK